MSASSWTWAARTGCSAARCRHRDRGWSGWTSPRPCSATTRRRPFADAARLPFDTGTFDAVTALNVLYHLADPVPVLHETLPDAAAIRD
jgi:Methyltransferase domain